MEHVRMLVCMRQYAHVLICPLSAWVCVCVCVCLCVYLCVSVRVCVLAGACVLLRDCVCLLYILCVHLHVCMRHHATGSRMCLRACARDTDHMSRDMHASSALSRRAMWQVCMHATLWIKAARRQRRAQPGGA